MKTVVLVGRPNVGKSTLFNKLVGKAQALVDDTPGLTRDWQEGVGHSGDLTFRLIDTAGFEDAPAQTLGARMWHQSAQAVDQADLVLFVLDAKEGITPVDHQIAQWLRPRHKSVLLVVNKGEQTAHRHQAYEAYALGLGDPLLISAAHGVGMNQLYEALTPYVRPETEERVEEGETEESNAARPIDVAIVGRPNAGKSTLINALLGEERLLTGPEAGVTRDAIMVPFTYHNQIFRLVDTAGLRKRAKVVDSIEKMSTHDTMEAIRLSQAVVLLIDAQTPLEKQDLTIARHVIDEGRILVIGINKWDLIRTRRAFEEEMTYQLERTLGQVNGLRVVYVSATEQTGIHAVLNAIEELYPKWNTRLSTGALNRWLSEVQAAHPAPAVRGKRLKIRYVTQVKSRPPSFVAFANFPQSEWPDSYVRYLTNSLRTAFDLEGIPLRLTFKVSDNPYEDRS